ncbi:uncharacterized protein V6R79_009728 [Siganus canaliculatus]
MSSAVAAAAAAAVEEEEEEEEEEDQVRVRSSRPGAVRLLCAGPRHANIDHWTFGADSGSVYFSPVEFPPWGHALLSLIASTQCSSRAGRASDTVRRHVCHQHLRWTGGEYTTGMDS